jgi:ATP-dependent exoDNAse (exonuclease V) beta subunit
MTIHKAKGLEFDIVILPGLHQVAGGNNRPLLRLVELKLDGADGVLMAPLKHKGAEGSSLYEYLSALDSEEEICEAQRTLYVASTRARGELHLFGAWRMTGSGKNRRPGCRAGTFMHMLWECFEDQVDQATVDNAAEGAPEEPPLLPQLKLRDEPCMPKVEPVPTDIGSEIEMRIPDRNATALGDALHLWLELIHNHWADQWTADWFKEHPDTLDSSLVRAGAEQEKLPELRARLNEMICNVLESVEGRSVVSPEGKSGSWAELALYSCENVHLRRHVLDRVHVNEESDYVIVDYKTGKGSEAQAEKWQQQLDRYGELVAIISGKPVRKKMIFSL